LRPIVIWYGFEDVFVGRRRRKRFISHLQGAIAREFRDMRERPMRGLKKGLILGLILVLAVVGIDAFDYAWTQPAMLNEDGSTPAVAKDARPPRTRMLMDPYTDFVAGGALLAIAGLWTSLILDDRADRRKRSSGLRVIDRPVVERIDDPRLLSPRSPGV
jgi:hypothetical protein